MISLDQVVVLLTRGSWWLKVLGFIAFGILMLYGIGQIMALPKYSDESRQAVLVVASTLYMLFGVVIAIVVGN